MRSSSARAASGESPSPISISKYFPWRTSATPLYPTVSMAWWMALPCGSRTPGRYTEGPANAQTLKLARPSSSVAGEAEREPERSVGGYVSTGSAARQSQRPKSAGVVEVKDMGHVP